MRDSGIRGRCALSRGAIGFDRRRDLNSLDIHQMDDAQWNGIRLTWRVQDEEANFLPGRNEFLGRMKL
jgi:hypothetical protein